jgi:copper chaperone
MKALCSGLIFEQETAMNHLFTVEGMTCGHCDKAVTRALVTVDPQAQVIIDRDHHRVTIESDQLRETLRQAIVQEGYDVSV